MKEELEKLGFETLFKSDVTGLYNKDYDSFSLQISSENSVKFSAIALANYFRHESPSEPDMVILKENATIEWITEFDKLMTK